VFEVDVAKKERGKETLIPRQIKKVAGGECGRETAYIKQVYEC
jgi:hypothetical protein